MKKTKSARATSTRGKPTTASDPAFITGPKQINAALDGLGFERVKHLPGTTYRDSSTVVVVPERTDRFHVRVVQAWQGLIAPMNQRRAFIYVTNQEVGTAYTETIKQILAHKELSKWRYVLTLESDNLPPADAHVRLLESIETFKLDAVSGIYFTKGDVNMPMCYGDPAEYVRTGKLDFKPLDIRPALAAGNQVVECNGIAMGCALWRMELFRQVPPPWFVTVADVVDGTAKGFTQDLYFCEQAKRAGKRFGVDTRVRVGHLDFATGQVF